MPSDQFKSFADRLREVENARNQGADYTSEPPQHVTDVPSIGEPLGADKTVILTCGASLTPEPVCWLWKHWLALGKFHLLAGAPGQGKTTIAMGMAATVTIGGRWPDGTICDAGNILIWSGEDDYRDTLLPRLIGAGANRNRVFFVDSTRVGDEVRPFDPASDTRTLLQAVEAIGGVRLIVIDPVSTAIQGDSHKNSEVRRGLQPLVDLAETAKAAVLGITHLSKAGQPILDAATTRCTCEKYEVIHPCPHVLHAPDAAMVR
jgi:putative DNA primase/helicase